MKEIYLKDMEIQWLDHFHMRDQTWKTLQYTILIFIGAVGLTIKDGVEPNIITLAFLAVTITSILGLIVSFHHRNRQEMKFEIIKLYEDKLELKILIDPILKKYEKGFFNNMNTSTYIVAAQFSLFIVASYIFVSRVIA